MDFSETQWKTLRAVLDRLIPADDYPGAWEAGVGDYIARQLAGDLQSLQSAYRDGLTAVETEAVTRFGVSFAGLDASRQDSLLRDVEVGAVETDWPLPPQSFFLMLVNHAAEGYYSDPGNGGNRDAVSWEMIGF